MIKTDFVWLSSGEIFVSIGWRLLVFPGEISSASSENWVWCLWWWHHASYWDTASSFLVTTERSRECQSATNCSCNGYNLRWKIRLGRTFLMLRKMSSWWTSHKTHMRRIGEFQFHFTINNEYSINHQAISWQDSLKKAQLIKMKQVKINFEHEAISRRN